MTLTPLLLLLGSPSELGVGFEPSRVPTQTVGFIERTPLQGRMFNDLPLAGHLAWHLYPKHQVLVDGLSPDPITPWVTHSDRDGAAFASLVSQFDLQWAVVRNGEQELATIPIAQSEQWAMVHFDDTAAVYVRRDGPNAPLASTGYRLLRHLTQPAFVLQQIVRKARLDDVSHDGSLAVQQAPQSPRAAFFEVCGALSQRDQIRWDRAMGRLERLAPDHPAMAALTSTARNLGLDTGMRD